MAICERCCAAMDLAINLDEGTKGELIKFAENTKLRGLANTLENKFKIQNDSERL